MYGKTLGPIREQTATRYDHSSERNDLDQILYKESMEKRLPGSIQSLELVQHSWLAQWILYLRGADKVELQMESAKQAVINKQGSFIEAMYQSAAKRNIDIVIVNLPYAYGYYYGDHMMELCTVDTCKPEVRIDLNTYEEVQANAIEPIRIHTPDFVTKTAEQMSLSEEELALVFPQRDCFFDVVHLSPLGHAVVAEQLADVLKALSRTLINSPSLSQTIRPMVKWLSYLLIALVPLSASPQVSSLRRNTALF